MSQRKPKAVAVLYNAVLSIGAINRGLHSDLWCIARAQQIANEALQIVNSDCTLEIQRDVFSMPIKRGKAGAEGQ